MNSNSKLVDALSNLLSVVVIITALIVSYFIYHEVLGNPENFVDGDSSNEPREGKYLGMIFKGGQIVILQVSFMIILLTYAVERAIALFRARGSKRSKYFALEIKGLLRNENLDSAIDKCREQKGAVANVVMKGLISYRSQLDNEDSQEERAYKLKRDLEEATHLEIPDLEKNMIIIGTIASIATLIGLLGTVTGMIRAFSALAVAGTPDAVGLAEGISQALVTTALGISTSAVAIVFFNFYTSIIDGMTYAMDETNYALLDQLKSVLKKDKSQKLSSTVS